MQEAGPMNLLRTILIFIAIYYGFKLLMRYVAPFFIKRFLNKMEQKAQQQFENQQAQSNVNVGETIIDKTPKNENQTNKSVGEYVDFEEIE